jgi:hypothetical protein
MKKGGRKKDIVEALSVMPERANPVFELSRIPARLQASTG